MSIVNASEFVKTHIRWIWEAPDDEDERVVAAEAVTALFALAEGWIDIIALEARLGLYDHEILTEAQLRPPEPFHLLHVQPSGEARIKPTYRPLESQASTLDAATATTWIDAKLLATPVPESRYTPSLRELLLAGSRVRLPEDVPGKLLKVSCYAGEIDVPVDSGWVTAPSTPPGVPSPISLRITNLDGLLRLVLEVFWSPWASAPVAVAPIRDGLARLKTRNWRLDE
jgi:hypothetical protein